MFKDKYRAFKLICIVYSISAFLLGAVSQAQAAIYSLGDSLSDAGALGFTYTNPTSLEPLAEGNVWVQYIAKSTPAFCNDFKHCKFNRETFYYSSMGNNYAVGGAGVTFDSTDANLTRNFTSLHYQVEALEHNQKLKKNDVITVWMGANDILEAANDPATSVANVKKAGIIFKEEVAELAKSGSVIVVITIPLLGNTPLGLSASDGGVFLNQLTDLFNQKISKLAKLKNVTIVDSNVYFSDVLSSRDFDTSNIYCSEIIDPTHQCGDVATNPITGNVSEVPFVFADPIHPSNAVHRFVGEKLKSLLIH